MLSEDKKNTEYNGKVNLYNYWKVIANRKRLITGIFLISVILTAAVNLLMPKVYRGDAILEIKAKKIIAEKELMDLIVNRREAAFPGTFHSITNLRVIEVKGTTDKLKVTIESKSAADIQNAFNELTGYVNNYPVFKKSIEDERKKMQKQIEKLSLLIRENAVFAKKYEKLFQEDRLASITFNPVDLKQKVQDLEEQKLSLEAVLNELAGVELGPAYITGNPVKPKVRRNIIIAGVVGLLVGIFLAIYMESERLRLGDKK